MIGGPVKSVLAKVAVTVGAGIATILSTARMAFAASTGMSLSPEYDEILRLAQQKVLAATQPGAFGNGVPMLYGAKPTMLLPWIGVALSAAIAVICAAKLLAPRISDDALLAHQLQPFVLQFFFALIFAQVLSVYDKLIELSQKV